MRLKINLDTMSRIKEFVHIAENTRSDVLLTNDNHQFVVNGKSLMGILYCLEWGNGIWLECDDEDTYSKFKDFIVD